MDTGLDQDETVLGILVLAVTLKMLANRHSLLDEEVQVLRDGRSKTYKTKKTFVSPHSSK